MSANSYLDILHSIDPVANEDLKAYAPFIVDGIKVGLLEEKVCQKILEYGHLVDNQLLVTSNEEGQAYVTFSASVTDSNNRTKILKTLTEAWREAAEFNTLAGWRGELFAIHGDPNDPRGFFFELERSASPIFGIGTYGSHLNGLVRTENKLPKVWIGQRAASKQTWPNFLDNTVGGGISSGCSPKEIIIKESMEEAGIPSELATNAVLTGTVSYMIAALGLEQSTLFVYDLYLPDDFQPVPQDGEVGAYYLYSFEEIEQLLLDGKFMPDAAIVIIDLFIRFGYLTPETNPHYQLLVYGIHRRLEVPPMSLARSS
ncbi:hypothetical protein K493DRAFT_312188 [Basidiobolus meristosporus CBS 931.73]|uniref:Nudix hydrolase domain-containing protein n=1 Tax=Basidiobolus meristosporus CBS 931.73 TaxID=1314790 RepID=A0A1Y1YW01_9FUNG|nr:hypothetical protein K493DRAFT_312188 [Basidiobolus meristosporus CBS 931.73]|eukprot:ORY02116.1 hypothetical protein K493DRAFT_312188 [Basidiobolus meristosporus CBS 931.73]